MEKRTGFDNKRYLQEQTAAILERVALFGNKLYLEFGGKLLFGTPQSHRWESFFLSSFLSG
jgi:uncharacterized protein (UPF0371 family)